MFVTLGTTFAAIIVNMMALLVFDRLNLRKIRVRELDNLARIIANNRYSSVTQEFNGTSDNHWIGHDRRAKEMRSTLTTNSPGVRTGAIFSLQLPLNRAKQGL